jgi:guanylate kinase
MSIESPPTSGPASASGRENTSSHEGRLFVLSAPSGAGKSTLCRILRQRRPALRYSISYTTRSIRAGEVDGQDYFFIDANTFQEGIAAGRWLEWARVHGHYYGTAADFIDRTLAAGHDLLLDIDVQGADQLVQRYPQAVTIFIMPPSMDELRQRLAKRGTDAPDVIAARLRNAREEMAARSRYRYIVVNDQLDQAVEELLALVDAAGRPTSAQA